jgi:hypothetical protein
LFDVNRTVKFGPLLRRSADTALARLLPAGARTYRTTVITNADGEVEQEIERTTEAGATTERIRALGVTYPAGFYSLSHVALPFPMNDSLYGLTPDPAEDFGIHLGMLAPRGERNVLIASLDALLRVSSNPFFPYMLERIEEGMNDRTAGAAAAPATSAPPRGIETGDEASRWSFSELVDFIFNLMPDRSDSSSEPP